MKKIFFIVGVICIFFMQSNVLAYQNEKNGFDDFYWGQTIEEIQKNYEVKLISNKDNESKYIINISKLIYGQNVEDRKIIAYFYKNKLYMIDIYFISDKNNKVLLDLRKNLIFDFGEPTNIKYNSWENSIYKNVHDIVGFNWEGKRTSIYVDEITSDIKLTIIDKYTENQKMGDIRVAQRKKSIINVAVFIVILLVVCIVVLKLVKKLQKPVDKYFLLTTNALFAIILLYNALNKENGQLFVMFLISIYNIYGLSSKIKTTFYIWLYFIFNLVFLLIDINLVSSVIKNDVKVILFGIEVVNLIVSIFLFKKLIKTKSEHNE